MFDICIENFTFPCSSPHMQLFCLFNYLSYAIPMATFHRELLGTSQTWIRESIFINDTSRGVNSKTWKTASSLGLQQCFLHCKSLVLRACEDVKTAGLLVICGLQGCGEPTTGWIAGRCPLKGPDVLETTWQSCEYWEIRTAAELAVVPQLETQWLLHYLKGSE